MCGSECVVLYPTLSCVWETQRAAGISSFEMALTSVAITSNALEVALSHALTTEREEIMGLLLGDVVDAGGTGKGQERLTARIWSVSLHRRETDVRSDDRVEISPEQLAAAAGEAERISEELGIHTRVVGWLPPPLPCLPVRAAVF